MNSGVCLSLASENTSGLPIGFKWGNPLFPLCPMDVPVQVKNHPIEEDEIASHSFERGV